MSEKIMNRPAFPCGESYTTADLAGNEVRHSKGPLHHGMSLRDYFAAKAMNGIISACGDEKGAVDYEESSVAKNAYAMADAMLKEREK